VQEIPIETRRPSRTTILLLIALAMVPYFVNLGTPPLWDANESLYAQPPLEVLEWDEGDFLAPTWNGKPYFAHPPLATWITVPFYAWLGPSELAHRLPMALAALLIVAATFVLGRHAGGPRVGLLAALILAATPRFWLFCRQLSGDVYFVALLAWALALAVPVLGGGGSLRRLRIAHVLVGVGFLAKGPVILVLYLGTIGLAWLFAKPRSPLGELRPVRGVLLMLALGAPWFVYMGVRYTDVDFVGWYLGVLLGDAQPWLPVLPFGIVMALRRDRRIATLLPIAGLVWTVFFFTLSAGKRNVYLLPIYPLMAVLVAPAGLAVIDGAYRWSARLAGCAASFGCLAGAVTLYFVADRAPRLQPEVYWPMWALLAAAGPLAWGGIRGNGRQVTTGAIATVLVAQLSVCLAFPALARFRPIPAFAETIRAAQSAAAPEPAILYRISTHSLHFYLGRATRVASSAADLREKMRDRRVAFLVSYARRFDAPDRRNPTGPRVGLKHDMPDAVFETLATAPLYRFHFPRSVLGRGGPPTEDLLLLRVTLPAEESER
jgi:4-amino-4-deoxy-L-arabinose transferase-like glycosyltransferase